MMQIATITSFI